MVKSRACARLFTFGSCNDGVVLLSISSMVRQACAPACATGTALRSNVEVDAIREAAIGTEEWKPSGERRQLTL